MIAVDNPRRLLQALDARLDHPVDFTLYGRAALHLGFADAPEEFGQSRDVDAVLWLGQAEELARTTNFWDAVDEVNQQFSADGLYITHLFTEDQIILTPEWRLNRVQIIGPWRNLAVSRLGNVDLFLSKLMRDDPMDFADAKFIVARSPLSKAEISAAIARARVPDLPELIEQFAICARRFL